MSDLFSLLGRMVTIRLLGSETSVPENIPVLRALQYLYPMEISNGDFCWNNECGNCEVVFRRADSGAGLRRTRCCQYIVVEGMEIMELSKELQQCIGARIRRQEGAGPATTA